MIDYPLIEFLISCIMCSSGLFYYYLKSENRFKKLIGIKADCCKNEYNLNKLDSGTMQCTYCKRIFYIMDSRTGKRWIERQSLSEVEHK